MISPESLVQEWLGEPGGSAVYSGGFYVPYDALAQVDGWVVWLGHPPAPDGLTLAPFPEEVLWGEPAEVVAAALLVSADYAVRRGATTTEAAKRILQQEAPLALVVPGDLHPALGAVVEAAAVAGVPVVRGALFSNASPRGAVPSFDLRSRVHAVDLGLRHDPALSFQERRIKRTIGGNDRSVLFAHLEGERDGIDITGEFSATFGLEIGLTTLPAGIGSTEDLRQIAAEIPDFLDGVSSWIENDSLVVGWDTETPPTGTAIAGAISLYLKELYGATLVDLRLSFAPDRGSSETLAAMSARARQH
jgi:hypothetical protein